MTSDAVVPSPLAHEAGDVVVRAGIANVTPDVDDSNVAGGALDLDVDSNAQIGLTATYFVTPTVGVQLLAATPFKHDIQQAGLKSARPATCHRL